ncbi:glycosyltransferase family 2 protein [Microbispora sp. RL4-1S]|uniref:Glycosyltransferase family 2 protein n=1 Tax=Microbispora oryzae TaxID=2806554 RepID=A0A940WUI8_9ACTN|nr:glycosyltransferase family 2 protein [Microbispora oryzae]MBP2707214.1 glycosyltransferase family 2 protein [Microbispora oryzae]
MTPSVGVVVPTRGDRPGTLAAALTGVFGQAYEGRVEVIVVVDGGRRALCDAVRAAGVPREAAADVLVLPNRRTPGLPGARNTAIEALGTDLVAFCDDDDLWLPGKLAAQVAALARRPEADFASCSVEVEYGSRRTPRLAYTDQVTREHLTRSRMMMVHSSTFLFRRGAIWVDESAPGGQNEDWDLALRAAWRHPIVHVDRPLVRIRWGASHYADRWADRIAGLEWMLARHPELSADSRGVARVFGQLAFSHAALGRRGEAARWALRAAAARVSEPRAALALAVACGLVSPATVVRALNARGHGI